MKKPEIWKLVLGCLLPAKSDFSRDDWRTYIQRYLLPEIQTETLRFYGENTSAEALHPGLDYANPGHRARLQAFPRHNQLFGVLDNLRLTESEIHMLCKWEGTKLAKEHFERQHMMRVKDTTWDGIQSYSKQTPSGYLISKGLSQRCESAQVKTAYELGSDFEAEVEDEEMEDSEVDEDEGSGEESEDELQRSYGMELNQRLIDGSMDADWEQWMKEAIERGDVPESLDPSHTQALQGFARLSSQNRAQILRGLGSAASLPGSSSSPNGVDAQRPRIDPTSQVLNDDGTVTQHTRPLSHWTSHQPDSYRPATQSLGTSSSASRPSAPQTAPLSSAVNPRARSSAQAINHRIPPLILLPRTGDARSPRSSETAQDLILQPCKLSSHLPHSTHGSILQLEWFLLRPLA